MTAASAVVGSLIFMAINCFSLYVLSELLSRLLTDRVSIKDRSQEALIAFVFHTFPIALLYLNSSVASVSYFVATLAVIEFLPLRIFFRLLPLKRLFRPEKYRVHLPGWQHWIDGDGFTKLQKCLEAACFQSHVGYYILLAHMELLVVSFFGRIQDGFISKAEWVDLAIFLGVYAVVGLAVSRLIKITGTNRSIFLVCFASIFDSGDDNPPSNSVRNSIGTERWLEPNYLRLSEVARSIERSIPRLQKQLTARHFREVANSYGSLALHIRERAAQSTTSSSSYIDQLLWMAVTIETNSNLLASARRISRIIPPLEEYTHKRSRFTRLTLRVDDFLAANRRLFGVVAIISILAYYIYTKDIASIVSFGRAIIGG